MIIPLSIGSSMLWEYEICGYVAFHDVDNKKKAPFALYAMPITYAIAASGWIVGYMPGAADWTSVAASNLIEFLYRS